MSITLHLVLCLLAVMSLTLSLNVRANTFHLEPSKQAPLGAASDASYSLNSIGGLLHRVADANRTHNYQGLLTYEANGSLSTLRLQHEIIQNTVHQKLEFLDGAKRQFMRNQGLGACTTGNTRWGLWPSVFNVDELSSLYYIGVLGSERVADRLTKTIDLVPKDQFRYGYRFNVDEKTGLLLRSSIVHKGQVIERTQFVSISLQPVLDSDDLLTANDRLVAATMEDTSSSDSMLLRVPEVDPCHTEQFNSAWTVQWLPVGFSSAGNRITTQGEQVLMFTDGLVSVSVFIIANDYGSVPKLTARRGATVAVMAPLGLENNIDKSRNVVVVGEIPAITARSIAVSVKESKP